MNKGKSSLSSPLPTMTDQLTPPSLRELIDGFDKEAARNCSILWLSVGLFGFMFSVLGPLNWLQTIPSFREYLTDTVMYLLALLVGFAGLFLFCYLGLITHYMPSKPVGNYVKHGFELTILVAGFFTHWYHGYEYLDVLDYSAFIWLFHAFFRQQRHPVDLGWLDFFLEEVMQVTVYVCRNNIYAIVNLLVWVMVIGYRFCSYSYPQVSDYMILPASNQKSELEEA